MVRIQYLLYLLHVLLSLVVYLTSLHAVVFQFVQCTSEEAFVKPHCYYEKEGNGFLPISPCPETVQAYPGRWLSHIRWDEAYRFLSISCLYTYCTCRQQQGLMNMQRTYMHTGTIQTQWLTILAYSTNSHHLCWPPASKSWHILQVLL